MCLKVYKQQVPIIPMTKLQKQLSRKVGVKEYPKYVAVLPPKIIEKAGLKGGEELKITARKGKITLEKVRKELF